MTAPGIGHNSEPVAAAKLKSFVERVERLEQEKSELAEDIREVYAEAKGAGFDPKVMRMVVRRRRMEPQARTELDETLAMYEEVFS